MQLFWLFYRAAEKSAGVAIIEGTWLVDARMKAKHDRLESGVRFATGYALSLELASIVAPGEIGRFLSLAEANRIISRFEAAACQDKPAPASPFKSLRLLFGERRA
jgi:hypothetical protein